MENSSRILSLFVLNGLLQAAVIVLAADVSSRLLNGGRARMQNLLWRTALILSVLLPVSSAFALWNGDAPPTVNALDFNSASFRKTLVSAEAQWPLAGLFLFSLAYRSAKLIIRMCQTRNVLRVAGQGDRGRIDRLTSGAKVEGLLRGVEIRFSQGRGGPSTAGVFRPAILIPHQFASESSDELLLAGIAHEVAHIRRADYAWLLFEESMLALLAFHPLAIIIGRKLHQTREMAADALAAEMLSDRRRYASCLIAIAATSVTGRHPAVAFAGDDFGTLRKRISRLASPERTPGALISAAAACLVVIAATLAGSYGVDLERPIAPPSTPMLQVEAAQPVAYRAPVKTAKKWKRGFPPPPPPPPPK